MLLLFRTHSSIVYSSAEQILVNSFLMIMRISQDFVSTYIHFALILTKLMFAVLDDLETRQTMFLRFFSSARVHIYAMHLKLLVGGVLFYSAFHPKYYDMIIFHQ